MISLKEEAEPGVLAAGEQSMRRISVPASLCGIQTEPGALTFLKRFHFLFIYFFVYFPGADKPLFPGIHTSLRDGPYANAVKLCIKMDR